jgi:hypothetical protein
LSALARFKILWVCPDAGNEQEAAVLARKAVNERLGSKGRVIAIAGITKSSLVHRTEVRGITHYNALVDVEAWIPTQKLGKLFDGWKIVADSDLSKPASAGDEAA